MEKDTFIFAGKNQDGSIDHNARILDISSKLTGLLKDLKKRNQEHKEIVKEVNETPDFLKNISETSTPKEIQQLYEEFQNRTNITNNSNASNEKETEQPIIDKSTEQKPEKVEVKKEHIEEGFKLTSERKKQIRDLPSNIKTKIFGQDDVVDDVVSVLKTAFAGLSSNKKKPKGAYIFAGPSGCGKTETVLQISEFLNVPIKKFSMTEFSEENDVKKLIGAPAGYVGYEDGGQLTNFVKDHPHSIILFDEIEKADPSLSKILLGVLEDGKLTDGKGQEVNFSNTMFFATSNLGSEIEYAKNISQIDKEEYRMNAIKGFFPIEVINRFDSLIQFKAISKDVYKKIVTKVLNNLSTDFSENHEIKFSYDDKVLDFIVDHSYDPAMGGRPAGRFMSKVLIKSIVDKIFDESLDGVDQIKLSINAKQNIVFKNVNNKIITEVKETSDLLNKYNQTRLTKEEQKIAQENNQSNDDSTMEIPKIDLSIKPTKTDKKLLDTANKTNSPIIQAINKQRIEKNRKPKRA